LRAIAVVTGINDSKFSEVVSGEIADGQMVITGTKTTPQ
jgi:hypothetical protein